MATPSGVLNLGFESKIEGLAAQIIEVPYLDP